MSQATRTIVTFESDKFKGTETDPEYGGNSVILGEDVCKWFIAELSSDGIECDTVPSPEDHGWYFNYSVGAVRYCLVCGCRPGDEQDPPVWVGWVERSTGFVAALFGARDKGIEVTATRQIHQVLTRSSEVSNVRWHFKKDFDRGNEEAAQESPG